MKGLLLIAGMLWVSPAHAEYETVSAASPAPTPLGAETWTPPGTLIFPRLWRVPPGPLELPEPTNFFDPPKTKFEASWPVRVYEFMSGPMKIASIGNFDVRLLIIFE